MYHQVFCLRLQRVHNEDNDSSGCKYSKSIRSHMLHIAIDICRCKHIYTYLYIYPYPSISVYPSIHPFIYIHLSTSLIPLLQKCLQYPGEFLMTNDLINIFTWVYVNICKRFQHLNSQDWESNSVIWYCKRSYIF